MEVNKETGGMEKEEEYTEGGMDRVRRMGEGGMDGWKEGWKEECDRWVVPGQSWEGAERLASQGERTHNTHNNGTHTPACAPLNSSHACFLLSGVFLVSFSCVKKTSAFQ